MISNFQYTTNDGITLNVSLGYNQYAFAQNDRSDISNFYKSKSWNIKWTNNGREIFIEGNNIHLNALPSLDLQKVIVIYPVEGINGPVPNYAIIYNADGTIHMKLIPPKVISEQGIKSRQFFKSEPTSYFESVRWSKNNKGEMVTSMKIGFDWDWYEERVIDPVTGEFGECLSSGRR